MPELIPIWQDTFSARWMVTVAHDIEEGNPWAGWTDVDSDARRGVVEFAEYQFTPDEARNLADALMRAASHAETFGYRVNGLMFELTCPGTFPEINHLPIETQRVVREAMRAAGHRYLKQQATFQQPTAPEGVAARPSDEPKAGA